MVLGWDIGGAHVKVARVGPDGRIDAVRLVPCQLWRGLVPLRECLQDLKCALLGASDDERTSGRAAGPNTEPGRWYGEGPAKKPDIEPDRRPSGGGSAGPSAATQAESVVQHAVTMSGELVDLFGSRTDGVVAILNCLCEVMEIDSAWVFSQDGELQPVTLPVADAAATAGPYKKYASANWRAALEWLAQRGETLQFADLGSTTLDVGVVEKGALRTLASDDLGRLAQGELVYVGAIRTPVFYFLRELEIGGLVQPLIPEYFADIGDALLVTGDLLPEQVTQPALDGRARDREGALVRLARGIGCDRADHPEVWFESLAIALRDALLAQVARSLARQRLRCGLQAHVPVVLAGVGCGIVRAAAEARGWPVRALADDLEQACTTPALGVVATECAPAATLALLLARRLASAGGIATEST